MKKLNRVVIFIGVTLLQSCIFNNKATFISDFKEFVDKVDANYKSYTSKDWQEADKTFSDFSEVKFPKYRPELTDNELSEVNDLIGKYNAIKIKAGLKDLKNSLMDQIQQAGSTLKEMLSDSSSTQESNQ